MKPRPSSDVKCAPCLIIATLMLIVFIGAIIFALIRPAGAMDHGFDPLAPTTKWIETLQQPPNRPSSCCGIAEAYQADTYRRNPDGSYDIVITEGTAIEYPDGSHRTPLKNGTKLHIDADRVNNEIEQSGNPTGHAWVFLSVYGIVDNSGAETETTTTPGTIYCFVPLPDGS